MVREATDGHGADVILDNMGAAYLGRNVSALALEGRLVVIGMQGGTKAELDLSALMRKRAAIVATTLRARPVAEKSAICRPSPSTSGRSWPTGRSSRSSTRRCRWPRPPRRTAGWRAAATPARSSWSPERLATAVCRLRG